mmetsp:Transcript_18335/g.36889  ORF Transcript_18335/g.36889 Transcript_18335/m.36889 type:complete len:235 (+) Transcript_18335:519-1223(+)
MHRIRLEPVLLQLLAHLVRQCLLGYEHEDLVIVRCLQHFPDVLLQHFVFDGFLLRPAVAAAARAINDDDFLHNALSSLLLGIAPIGGAAILLGVRNAHRLRVLAAQALREPLDGLVPSRGEEQRLALGSSAVGDADDIVVETHVQHAVGLVQDEVRDEPEFNHVGVREIDEAPRRPHQKVHTILQVRLLRPLVAAAIHARDTDRGVVEDFLGLLGDLHGQFARWRQDERGSGDP